MALDVGSSTARTVLVDPAGVIVGDGRAPVVWRHPVPVGSSSIRSRCGRVTRATMSSRWTARRAGPGRSGARHHQPPRDQHGVGAGTGRPAYDAMVWISNQTDDIVQALGSDGLGRGVPDAHRLAQRLVLLRGQGRLAAGERAGTAGGAPSWRETAFGTVDTWLLWNLPAAGSHATDPSCASRTALFNLSLTVLGPELPRAAAISRPRSCRRCFPPTLISGRWTLRS